MPMIILTFKDWVLTVDHESTKSTYAAVENGSAEDCNCNECLNYIQNRGNIFPEQVKHLFNQLGVDYHKESEVWRMCRENDGTHRYSVIFHFKGSFEGTDCLISLNGSQAIKLNPITDSFKIGFTKGDDLTYFKDKNDLIQIEIEIMVPWVIDRMLESEW